LHLIIVDLYYKLYQISNTSLRLDLCFSTLGSPFA